MFYLSIVIEWLRKFDYELLKTINLERNQDFDGFFQLLSNTVFYIAWGVPVLMILYSLWKKNNVYRVRGITVLLTIVTTAAIVNLLKYTINRARPFKEYWPEIEKLSSGGSPSFPSGHTADAFALATAICLLWPKWYSFLIMFVWAGFVGFSRVVLGVHYPTDVIVGLVIGIIVAIILKRIVKLKGD